MHSDNITFLFLPLGGTIPGGSEGKREGGRGKSGRGKNQNPIVHGIDLFILILYISSGYISMVNTAHFPISLQPDGAN